MNGVDGESFNLFSAEVGDVPPSFGGQEGPLLFLPSLLPFFPLSSSKKAGGSQV